MSRRVRYQVAVSLDGFIAGPNGEYDWIVMDPSIDFGAFFKEFVFGISRLARLGRRAPLVAATNLESPNRPGRGPHRNPCGGHPEHTPGGGLSSPGAADPLAV